MDYLREIKKTCSRLGVGYAAFLVVGLLLQMEAGLILGVLGSMGWMGDWNTWIVILGSLPTYLLGTLICWLIVKDMATPCRPRKQPFGAGRLVVAFFACISIMYIGNIIGTVLMSIVNGIQGKPLVNPVSELIENLDTRVIFLLTVVAAPIFEEILYRKLLIDRVAHYGDKVAVILSGVLFGLSHGNFYQFFYAFGLGVVFAYVYINTGKLRYTIIFHAIINFLGSIVALHAADNIWFAMAYSIFMLAAVVLGIVFLIIYRREISWKPAMVVIPRGRRFETLFLNLGMILFFFVSVGLFLLS